MVQEKSPLRAEAKARRRQLHARLPQAGEDAAQHFFRTFSLKQDDVVAAYWPLADELDTRPLMEQAQRKGVSVALPRIVSAGEALAFYRWQTGEQTQTNQYGIEEPLVSAPLLTPMVVLVPLLAFDKRGHRLGFGGGFYDRTLKALRRQDGPHVQDGGPIKAVGFGFAEQEIDNVPTGEHDERLDYIVTEAGCLTVE